MNLVVVLTELKNKHGKEINIDDAGFLQNSSDWNEEFASETAQKFNLFLTNDHWEVIKFIRNYYTEHNRVPELRKLLKVFKTSYGNDKSSRKYIYNLFPLWIWSTGL